MTDETPEPEAKPARRMKLWKKIALITVATLVVLEFASHGVAHIKGGYGWKDHHMKGGHDWRGGWAHHKTELFEAADADSDERLAKDEARAFAAGRLRAHDADGDGTLTLEEFAALWADFHRRRMVDRFQFFDDDGDARVTQAELLAPFAGMLERLDRNGDGDVTKAEMHRHMRGHGHGHHGRRDHRDDDD